MHTFLRICLFILLTGATSNALLAQELNLALSTDFNVVGVGNTVTFRVTTSNSGTRNLSNVTVQIELPPHITTFSEPPGFDCSTSGCNPGEVVTWTAGTLIEGESQSVFYRTSISTSAPEATITTVATASANNTDVSDVTTSHDVTIDPSPLLMLNITSDPGPIEAGSEVRYLVNFGNYGTVTPTDVQLTFTVPNGSQFVSATGGGTEEDRVVTWDIGLLAVGASRRVEVVLQTNANLDDGDLLRLRAEIEPNLSTENAVAASYITTIKDPEPLDLKIGVSRKTVQPDGSITFMFTASNTGIADLTDIAARLILFGSMDTFSEPPGFDCSTSGCNSNEAATWTIGTLAPGESRTVFYRTFISGSAVPGALSRAYVILESSSTGQVIVSQDVAIEADPSIILNIAPDPGPAIAGEEITYTLSYGNFGDVTPTNTTLRMQLPDGAQFVEGTDGATEENGAVSWDIGLLATGSSKQVRATVLLDANLTAGTLLLAEAELDTGLSTAQIIESSTVTPVRQPEALELHYGVSRTTIAPNGALTATLTATNTGTNDLVDVAARILLPGGIDTFSEPPGFDCSTSGCNPNEVATWTVGTLTPGESRTIFFRTFISDNASIGFITSSMLVVEATNARQFFVEQDFAIDSNPVVMLSINPDPGPAQAGQPFRYTINYGNFGDLSPSDVALRMSVPEGSTFMEASDGGIEEDGLVTWSLGALGTGSSAQVHLYVTPDAGLPDGSLLVTEAEIDAGLSTVQVIGASAVTPVREPEDLQVRYGMSRTTVAPNGALTATLTATNTGTDNLVDVSVRLLLPGGFDTFSEPPGFDCSTSGCNPNEVVTWTVGTLGPGESRTIFYRTFGSDNVTPGIITPSMLVAEATNAQQLVVSQDLAIDSNPVVMLSINPDPGPAQAGQPFRYTINYGNFGDLSPSDVALRMSVPEGSTFMEASDGGIEEDGLVTWSLGALGTGSSAQVHLYVTPDAGLPDGSLLVTEAEIDAGLSTVQVIGASAVTPVREPEDLQVRYGMSRTTVAPNGALTATLTATNTGTDNLVDVSVRLLLPGGFDTFSEPPGFDCSTSGCNPNEVVTWTVGTLGPGESRTIFYRTFGSDNVTPGIIAPSMLVAEATNAQQLVVSQDLAIDSNPVVMLSINPDPGPAQAGQPFRYTINYGNFGDLSPSDVALRMSVPEGSTFMEASDGATIEDGLVTWSLGALGTGSSAQVHLYVTPDAGLPDGSLLVTEAEIDAGLSTVQVIGASAVTPVREPESLHLLMGISQTSTQPGGAITVSLTASNTSSSNLINAAARILLPGGFNTFGEPPGFNCGTSSCNANEVATWTIGTLIPGESRTVFFRTFLNADLSPGVLLPSMLVAEATNTGQILVNQDFYVDPTPIFQLDIVADTDPIVAGDTVTYTITYGNVGDVSPADVSLYMALPEGSELISSTPGSSIEDDVVSWNLGSVGTGSGGRYRVSVMPDSDLPDGTLLVAESSIDPGISTEQLLQSVEVNAVKSQGSLLATYEASKLSVQPGEEVTYTLTLINDKPTDLLNLEARFVLPGGIATFSTPTGFDCGTSNCNANEVVRWTSDVLAAADTQVVSFDATVLTTAGQGRILHSAVVARSSNADVNEAFLNTNVLNGMATEINSPPTEATIIGPPNNFAFVIGGTTPEGALPPDSSFVVTWSPSTDEDGDALTYRWQLSASSNFDQFLVDELSADNGSATQFETDLRTLAGLLDTEGIPLLDSLTLYHRVQTTDGLATTESDRSQIILIRGTLVHTQDDMILPQTFDLQGNFPNPFAEATTFRFDLPETQPVTLSIYDITGREIEQIIDQAYVAGRHSFTWKSPNLPSGVYLYRMQAGHYSKTGKLIFLR